MKKPLKTKVRRRIRPRKTVAASRAKAFGKTRPGRVKMPKVTGDAHDDTVCAGSLRIEDIVRGAVPAALPPVLRLADCEATPVTATADRLDVACDYMPDWIEYLHLPPSDPPDEFRRLHLCVLLGADDEIVGSAYGSTWVKARIEACALYRRSLIRCVSVRKLD